MEQQIHTQIFHKFVAVLIANLVPIQPVSSWN